MYEHFFNLREKPFKLLPDPDYLFLSPSHAQALSSLSYAMSQGDGFVLITGEVGTGKTTLCRCFLADLAEDCESAYIFNTQMEAIPLLAAICHEFGVAVAGAQSSQNLLESLNQFLMSQHSRGRKTVLLIDEAQNLSVDTLEMVRLLSNLETSRHKLLHIILVGQPELAEKLESFSLRQLAQRISIRCRLMLLNRQQTLAFIEHRLQVAAKGPQRLFSPGACRAIFRYTRGIPRRINITADRALNLAYESRQPTVTAATARKAIRQLKAAGRTTAHRRVRVAVIPAVLILLLIAGIGSFADHGRRLRSLLPFQSVAQEPAVTRSIPRPELAPAAPQDNHRPSPVEAIQKPSRRTTPTRDDPAEETQAPSSAATQEPIAATREPSTATREPSTATREPSMATRELPIAATRELPIAGAQALPIAAAQALPIAAAQALPIAAAQALPIAAPQAPDKAPAAAEKPDGMSPRPPLSAAAVQTASPPSAVDGGSESSLMNRIAALPASSSRWQALAHLLSLWQQPIPQIESLSASMADTQYFQMAALQYGLRLLVVNNDLSLVRRLNLPAIVTLKATPQGHIVFATLVQWQDDQVRIALGSLKNEPLDPVVLQSQAKGPAYIFWFNSLHYDGIVSQKSSGDEVFQIKKMLRRIGYEHLAMDPVFDPATLHAVVDFQLSRGINPDGLVGPITKIMLLEAARAVTTPRLNGNGER